MSAPALPRVASIDAYRGFVMVLMLAEVLRLAAVAKAFPGDVVWEFLAFHQSHVEWRGCSLHDLIQPSFSFLVGAAVPFSLAARLARGQSRRGMVLHAAGRAIILILLGIGLRSVGRKQTNFTFEDTLTQIGLGYVPLFLLGLCPPRAGRAAFVAIFVGTAAAFALYPAPGPGFDFPAVGVPADWPHHPGSPAGKHYDKNSNLAWAFDTWFLNRFPRENPFTHNGGGYATLSFIPTLATMLLGLGAGQLLRSRRGGARIFARRGMIFLAVGLALDASGVIPSVKRIWTPAWVCVSGGWCLLLLAAFSYVCDERGFTKWAFPLRVVGANSIVAYCAEHLFAGFIRDTGKTHFGQDVYKLAGPAYEPLLAGGFVLAVLWLMLFWLYRTRVFVRV